MLSRSLSALLAGCCLLAADPASIAQSNGGSTNAAQQPGYTFQAGTRIVLTDVTVTDRNGNPVHGLKASDFQIFDNNRPQALASFEEYTTTPVAPIEQASTSPGVYSNEFLLHLPPVLNIIVIDITNLDLVDQMYLYYELNRFVKNLPAGQPLAIYWQSGAGHLMFQSFTTDRELLLAAVRRAIPRFPPPDRGYSIDSDFVTLQAIAGDFAQYPGRKNILWFSGGSTLFLHPDPMAFPNPDRLRSTYDALEASRIAIYPVDARGLFYVAPLSAEDSLLFQQQGLMKDIANATGGTAFYNNNGLDKIAARWLDNGGSFYTLTYSPSDLRYNNKWHKVKVKLNGDAAGYTLSYRHGYFADGSTGGIQRPEKLRRILLKDGEEAITAPDIQSLPIIFEAHVAPVSGTADTTDVSTPTASVAIQAPKKRTIPYSIHYSIPSSALTPKVADGKTQYHIGVAVIAFNDRGSVETHLADRFTLVPNQGDLHLHPNAHVWLDQQINLRKGQTYLDFVVWDLATGRLGTLQVAMKAERTKTH